MSDNISRKTQTIRQLNFFYSLCCIKSLISAKNPHQACQTGRHEFYVSILAHPPSVQNVSINIDISYFVLKKS